MKHRLAQVGLVLLLACWAAGAVGQKSTEMFVPIGQSPGVSGRQSLIARIQAVDASARLLTLSDAGATHAVRVNDQTLIWLDRSKLQQANREGTLADCRSGLLAEVKYRNNDRAAGLAEWVKVQAAP